jgi:hypothetical protein
MNSPDWKTCRLLFFDASQSYHLDLGRGANLSVSNCKQFGIGNGTMVGWTNCGARLLRRSVVQRYPAYQLMSFAGNRDRGSVNQTFLEPDVSYNFESGWYVQCEPSITYDWTADTANAWTIPMGADVGKAFKWGSRSLSMQIGAYDLLKRPDGSPQWIMRMSVTFLFPAGHWKISQK